MSGVADIWCKRSGNGKGNSFCAFADIDLSFHNLVCACFISFCDVVVCEPLFCCYFPQNVFCCWITFFLWERTNVCLGLKTYSFLQINLMCVYKLCSSFNRVYLSQWETKINMFGWMREAFSMPQNKITEKKVEVENNKKQS